MKRYIMIPALLLMAVAACNKSVEAPGPQTEKETGASISFDSYASDDDTKVTLDGLNLKWAAGDKIAVYSYKGSETTPTGMDLCDLTSGAGSASGTFAPENNLFGSGWVTTGEASDTYGFYSWYPTSATPAGNSETVANVVAAQSQGHLGEYLICWAQGSATKTRAQVIAGDTPSFSFSPKVALLKVAIKNSSAIPITVDGLNVATNSGYIAGNVTLDVKNGTISGGSSSSIEYTPSSQISIAAGATSAVHTIAVLPNAGTLTITPTSGAYNITLSSNTVINALAGYSYSVTVDVTAAAAKTILAHDADAFTDGSHYYGEANCVVIPSGTQSATLDVSLYKAGANHARGAVATDYLTAARSAAVIWTENGLEFSSLSLSNGYSTLNIELSKNDGGNALIGLYDGENVETRKLLWSFHVWAPVDGGTTVPNVQDNPNEHYAKAYNLALGQITNAYDSYMYYQWGRKDPLGRSASITNQTNDLIVVSGGPSEEEGTGVKAANRTGESVNNLDYARKNPTVFITKADNSSNTYDWYPVEDVNDASHRDNYLWNVVDGKGSIYDPCPKGYHVPASNSLWYNGSSFSVTINAESNWAFQHSRGLYYVLGGYRRNGDGSVGNVRSYGYYWSSTPKADSRDAYNLNFSASNANPENTDYRANGRAVRCVQN